MDSTFKIGYFNVCDISFLGRNEILSRCLFYFIYFSFPSANCNISIQRFILSMTHIWIVIFFTLQMLNRAR